MFPPIRSCRDPANFFLHCIVFELKTQIDSLTMQRISLARAATMKLKILLRFKTSKQLGAKCNEPTVGVPTISRSRIAEVSSRPGRAA